MDLYKLIEHYRNRLSLLSDSPLYGDIPEGAENIKEKLECFLDPEHKKFLLLCSGGSFGDIELWGTDEILDMQYRVPKNLQDSVYEIGQVLYESIFLNKTNHCVTFCIDKEKNILFSFFIKEYVFGDKYKYIFDNADLDDMWYSFLLDNPM